MSFDPIADHANRLTRIEADVADVKANVATTRERVDQGFAMMSEKLDALAALNLGERVANLEGIRRPILRRARRIVAGAAATREHSEEPRRHDDFLHGQNLLVKEYHT